MGFKIDFSYLTSPPLGNLIILKKVQYYLKYSHGYPSFVGLIIIDLEKTFPKIIPPIWNYDFAIALAVMSCITQA